MCRTAVLSKQRRVLRAEKGPGGGVPVLVQRGGRGGLSGQRAVCVPESGEEVHAIAAGLPGEPGRRQWQHGAALQRVALQLQRGQPAAGDRCPFFLLLQRKTNPTRESLTPRFLLPP